MKCIKTFTCNLYVFYFLLWYFKVGMTVSQHAFSNSNGIMNRPAYATNNHVHYSSQSGGNLKKISNHTIPSQRIHEAVHPFHPNTSFISTSQHKHNKYQHRHNHSHQFNHLQQSPNIKPSQAPFNVNHNSKQYHSVGAKQENSHQHHKQNQLRFQRPNEKSTHSPYSRQNLLFFTTSTTRPVFKTNSYEQISDRNDRDFNNYDRDFIDRNKILFRSNAKTEFSFELPSMRPVWNNFDYKTSEKQQDHHSIIKNNVRTHDEDYDYLNDEGDNSADDDSDPGSLTRKKWAEYGTPDAVERSSHKKENIDPRMAEHYADMHKNRIDIEAKCSIPKPQVIEVRAEATKEYFPSCTILHQCGTFTGCCSKNQVCSKNTSEIVYLYFRAINVRNKWSIEQLSFENHTSCKCIDQVRPNYAPRSIRDTVRSEFADQSRCRCVNHFSPKYRNINNHCECDCEQNNLVCKELKRGENGFSITERSCIRDKRCKEPTCEYGKYNADSGRCPKQGE